MENSDEQEATKSRCHINQEIQPKDYTRNDHDINEPEESPKNAEAGRRQTDLTLGQAW